MRTRRIATIVGTRPEAIKMAPVHLALQAAADMTSCLLATAQHREMLDQVLGAFGIVPDIDLDLMRPGQDVADLTARLLPAVGSALDELEPDAVLVQGDTTTCLCAALAAFYKRVPVGHVEAGLRTHDLDAPWPEEMNRRLTDPICRWCFAPTERAAADLRAERIPDDRIFVTGNTVVDALLLARERTRHTPPTLDALPQGALEGRRLILVTGHRRESFGQPFQQFCQALRDIVRRYDDVVIVYPVHLNPNVWKPVHDTLEGEERIHLIEPVSYLPFVHLMDRSHLIVTDSGGIQEEAPSFGKPVLVTRDKTERPEAVERGLAKLVGTDRTRITEEVSRLLDDADAYARMSHGANPYGDGSASHRIVATLRETL